MQADDERAQLSSAMRRLRRGERAAADEVFRRAWPLVRRFCGRWLQGSAAVDDVAQQALLKVFEQALRYDETKDAAAWVLEIALWECRSERTRVRRARAASGPGELEGPSSAATPDAAVERAELVAALGEAMGTLREADRAELVRVLEEEAAGDAGARKRRQRALERLKAVWRTLHGE